MTFDLEEMRGGEYSQASHVRVATTQGFDMRKALVLAVVLVVPVVGPAPVCAQRLITSGPLASVPAPVSLDTTGRFRAAFSRVGDDVYLAGQPTERGLRELHDQGVTTVVNLRTPEEMKGVGFDEQALVEQLGMTYVYLPVRGGEPYPYSPETVKKFADAMARTKGKILLHCTIAWRASHLWAAYLIAERDVPVEAALKNAEAINLMGHMSMGTQPVEDFLGRRLPELDHK
ncbi:MAG TPA: protein tyrosine phosphatase family protein [Gemmatimonadaceae bacterium]|nr:protein tyrosine phosphatase family protein [Gemmatimonadaceae bacterium]